LFPTRVPALHPVRLNKPRRFRREGSPRIRCASRAALFPTHVPALHPARLNKPRRFRREGSLSKNLLDPFTLTDTSDAIRRKWPRKKI
jgi:hypothetical protein